MLREGTEFYYKYDFGDTTVLQGQVLSVRPGKLEGTIRLLARNHLPSEVVCVSCGKIADVICSLCGKFFCDTKKCRKTHASCNGDAYLLPVVNSPRMGVCEYEGSSNTDCVSAVDFCRDVIF